MDSFDSIMCQLSLPAMAAPTKNPTRHIIIAQQERAMAGAADPTMTTDESTDPMMMMAAASGVATLVLASGLAYVMTRRSKE